MNDMIQYVLTQSVFGAMFIYLLSYVLKTNSERESKYQEIISDLTDKVGDICALRDDIACIKNKMFK